MKPLFSSEEEAKAASTIPVTPAADLIGQVSSFLTVTLPALGMAQAQGAGEAGRG
ncbi:hypothetical protein ABIB38_004762 [Massilia sp. UYP11]|uniref:hypothetical protein n=1 Tax=Massilia sp. UYP11 TaxID=1756385 RepID=UPI003D20E200